jgi:hypothetical protein
MIFEGPAGPLRSAPEVFSMAVTVTSLATGQLDDEYTADLTVAAGHELVIVHGRDWKLSLDREQLATVLPAKTDRRSFPGSIKSRGLRLGNFTEQLSSDIIVLREVGAVRVRRSELNMLMILLPESSF